jgi:hypothetical protein
MDFEQLFGCSLWVTRTRLSPPETLATTADVAAAFSAEVEHLDLFTWSQVCDPFSSCCKQFVQNYKKCVHYSPYEILQE